MPHAIGVRPVVRCRPSNIWSAWSSVGKKSTRVSIWTMSSPSRSGTMWNGVGHVDLVAAVGHVQALEPRARLELDDLVLAVHIVVEPR
jgi:hypothetical protein